MKIRVNSSGGRSFERIYDGPSLIVGRSSNSEISLPDRSMSREHARIFEADGAWWVVDLGSRNGTLLNGVQIDGSARLGVGDVLTLGGSTLEILSHEKAARAPDQMSSVEAANSIFVPAADLLGERFDTTAEQEQEGAIRTYVERLHIVNEVHQALGSSVSQEELLELILDRVFDHLKPEEGAVYLREEDEYVCKLHRSSKGSLTESRPLYSRNLIEQVGEKGMAALVLDAEVDERFNEAMSLIDAGIRSLVAAPLGGSGDDPALGFIVLGSMLRSRQFTEDDMELLTSLASVAAMRIHNLRLVAEAVERQRLEQEVALARRIQVALLPASLPSVEGYELFGRNWPSRGVSGDFFKIVDRNQGRECVVLLADVSGKGIAASLLTASLEALVTVPIDSGMAADEVCTTVSELLFARTPPEKYATAFMAALEVDSGRLRYVNAGHNPGILVRGDGSTQWLRSGGRPLGLLPGSAYQLSEVELAPGDCFFIYTDGLTEAENPEGEEYGESRLLETASRFRNLPLEEMADAIDGELASYAAGVPFADDRTVVFVRRSS